ncbi:hypothetical protein MOQ_006657 [Trypanosoma cruzi marinkellei]|uniref:Flagellar attachment zone protein 1 conserved domain-containing protein n=1 Tax=Trypanosoma cruzi marinkellei TaxID=85056 RepID=K2M3J5_TRYCR|nr:hypothetical protein MOQ_006657 [Trypanosoma cruzi marinkellei]
MTTHLENTQHSHMEGHSREPVQQNNAQPRTVNGLPVPVRVRAIDDQGYQLTKHALRFRGEDWDIVLHSKREELRIAFTTEAAAATAEPESNIVNIRFFLDESRGLIVKFSVRHRAQTSGSAVQDRLATYPYRAVMELYKPRMKKPRKCTSRWPSSIAGSFARQRRPQPTVSCYGHAAADVGPNGLEFRDTKEIEEMLPIPPEKITEPPITTIVA